MVQEGAERVLVGCETDKRERFLVWMAQQVARYDERHFGEEKIHDGRSLVLKIKVEALHAS